MTIRKIYGHPVLIIGAGRGGSALLEIFMEVDLVEVVAIADPNQRAPGMLLATSLGIPTYTDTAEALLACRDYPDCIVYNLTHDDSITEQVNRVFSNKKVTSGMEAKLLWQMVTNMKCIKDEFETSQIQLQAIINNMMDGIITLTESGVIQGFNPAAESIFGYSRLEVLGQDLAILMPGAVRGERDNGNYLSWHMPHSMSGSGREVTAVRKDGEQFAMELSVSEMVVGGDRYFVYIVRDITKRKQAEQKITHLAHHDYLTGLPNRALFMDRLEHSISLATRSDYKEAVLFLDLDGFKHINDTLGHGAGDLLLQEVAKRLKKVIRSSDTVARVGGDEFNFVLNNICAEADAESAAKNIIVALSEPFNLFGEECHVGGSIGISIYPDDAHDFETLLRQADEAMYLAKQSGKNTYKFYRDLHKNNKPKKLTQFDYDFYMASLGGALS
jgi:diguanylate cyclase (GGDEF)-like protein/PAS domain S-box-containing protein